MWRFALACVLVMGLGVPAHAGGKIVGNWKVTFFEGERELTFWLLTVKDVDGKLQGSAAPFPERPEVAVTDLQQNKGLLSFVLRLGAQQLSFEFTVPEDDAPVLRGSIRRPGLINPAQLERTKASSPDDRLTLAKETVERHPGTARAARAAFELVLEAAGRDLPVEEVRTFANQAFKQGEPFGPRWQRHVVQSLAEGLAGKKGYGEVALKVVEKAKELKQPGDGLEHDLQVLDWLARTYRVMGKTEDAAQAQAEIDKAEVPAYKEYADKPAPFKVQAFKGRKGQSNRVVLVELFTGAQCPPCVAADLAFDGLEKAYKTSEVVLLQYHLHIPRQDALTNADSEARQEYYGEAVAGTPSIFFNGKADAGGGGRAAAGGKHEEYLAVIDPLLEQPARAQLKGTATRKGDQVSIEVKVSDVDKPGDKVRLRLALVEEWVRYLGSNGLPFHHRVVRALPGGPLGFAVTEKTHEQKVEINLEDLRGSLRKYLDTAARELGPFPDQQRPLAFRNLRVVAFVQDDTNREVLQALEIPVKE